MSDDLMTEIASRCVARSEMELFESALSESGLIDGEPNFTHKTLGDGDMRYADDEIDAAFRGWFLSRQERPVFELPEVD